MKKYTNRILLIIIAVSAAVMVIAIALPYAARDILFVSKPVASNDNQRASLDLKGFERLVIKGNWDVRVSQGQWSVKVTAPKELVEKSCRLDGDSLVLEKIADDMTALRPKPRIDIVMPTLNAVQVLGAAAVRLEGFGNGQGKFALGIEGASDFHAGNCRFEKVAISCQGASAVNFSGCELKAAEVNVAGATSIKLDRMDGGELSGSLDGVASLEYSGVVSANKISNNGLSSVKQR